MAVRTREEIISQLSARIGEDKTDDAIALIEDVTDTIAELESKANGDGKDWKAEAERIDKEWRDKYLKRFSSSSDEPDDVDKKKHGTGKDYSFENLFKQGE